MTYIQSICDQGSGKAFLDGRWTPPPTTTIFQLLPHAPSEAQLDERRLIEQTLKGYKYWRAGQIDRYVSELVADEMQVDANYPGFKQIPFQGHYERKEGLVQYFQALQQDTELTGKIHHLCAIENNRVLVLFRGRIKGRKSGKVLNNWNTIHILGFNGAYKMKYLTTISDVTSIAALIRGEIGEDDSIKTSHTMSEEEMKRDETTAVNGVGQDNVDVMRKIYDGK
jgi:hypothetical protein